jgi:ribosomal protein S18 acetylase RimI-like enzyme
MQIQYRTATPSDIPSLARLRSLGWGEEQYWIPRITAYMNGENNPQMALPQRVVYVAEESGKVIGLIAGHLTRRLDCEGELEWIDVATEYRRKGIASKLVGILAEWFMEQNVRKVCVDPGNEAARKFYTANGAENLNAHWMYWKDIRSLNSNAK